MAGSMGLGFSAMDQHPLIGLPRFIKSRDVDIDPLSGEMRQAYTPVDKAEAICR
jgi:hypothetical protein